MLAPLVRRSWAPRGQTPIFYQRGRTRQKVSVIAALSLPPRRRRVGLYFSLYKQTSITASRVVRFLIKLSRCLQKNIIILWDRSRTHRAKSIQRLIGRSRRFHVHFFPAYSPELNPAEMLWGYLKRNPLVNVAPDTAEELSRTTRYHATKTRKRKKLLRSFLYATPLF
jgi:transposase